MEMFNDCKPISDKYKSDKKNKTTDKFERMLDAAASIYIQLKTHSERKDAHEAVAYSTTTQRI